MSLCPGIGGLLRWCCGRASDSVSVYECRRAGMLAGLVRYRGRGVIHGDPAAGRGAGGATEKALSWDRRQVNAQFPEVRARVRVSELLLRTLNVPSHSVANDAALKCCGKTEDWGKPAIPAR